MPHVPAEMGDIVLFNSVYTGQPMDHAGIVLAVASAEVLSAEGNVENRTGIFERPYSSLAGYVRLPESV